MPPGLPAVYRHFVEHGLTDFEPWSLQDNSQSIMEKPDLNRHRGLVDVCKEETGAEFDLYLFARRHDQDDYAFFVVRNGEVEDRVLSRHLAFCKKLEVPAPVRYEQVTLTFLEWVRGVVLNDIAFEVGISQTR